MLHRRPGANLIEVLVAAALAGVVLMAIGGFVVGMAQKSRQEADRGYAQRKALQILEELNAEQRRVQNIESLSRFANQGPRFELTLANVGPEAPISANPSQDGAYKFIRSVQLERVPGSDEAFQATVKVWRNTPRYTAPGIPPEKPVAVVSTILRNQLGHTQPVQVLKAYVLSIENIPHLFFKDPSNDADMLHPNAADMRSRFDNAVVAIEAANPWLKIDYQYITRLGVGRDPFYQPYVNNEKVAAGAGRDPFKWSFNYPGPTLASIPPFYSESTLHGRLRLGVAGTSDLGVAQNRQNYSFADEFNHPVRYPLEHANPSGQEAISAPTRIALGGRESDLSMIQLIDDMINNSENYKNAMIINLHGAAFPAAALRNYADAAKDLYDGSFQASYSSFPDNGGSSDDYRPLRARRVVTHPLHLVTPNSQPVRLLTHAYLENGANMPRSGLRGSGLWAESNRSRTARIVIPGLRPYLAKHDDPTQPGTLANDVRITVIQREDTGGGSREKYSAWRAWPVGTDAWSFPRITPASHEEVGGRDDHTGPHANEHPAGSHHGGAAGGTHGRDPRWIWPNGTLNGNDLEILLTDVEYDIEKVRDNGGHQPEYGLFCGKLHGLQYFPDPYLPFINEVDDNTVNYTEARNTARVIVEFRLRDIGQNKRFEVQTQLALNAAVPNVNAEGFHSNPNDPSISRTWFYGGSAQVPWTDRVQLVGDPRHNPYADLRQANAKANGSSSASLALNRYWSNFDKGNTIYGDLSNTFNVLNDSKLFAINPFLDGNAYYENQTPPLLRTRYWTHINGSLDSWSGMKFNGPAYFDLWRRALLSSNAFFVNPFDEPMKFVLLGGEFNLADKINTSADMKMSSGPFFGGTSDAGERADGLMEGSRSSWVVRADSTHFTWYAKPWLGELFDASLAHHSTDYSGLWRSDGNVRNEGGHNHMDISRVPINSVPGFDSLSDRTNSNDLRRPGEAAIKALLNAYGPGGSQWDQDLASNFTDATRTSVGDALFTALNLPTTASSIRVRGGYELGGGGSIGTSGDIAPGRLAWMPGGATAGIFSTDGMSPNQSVAAFGLLSDTAAAEDSAGSRASFVLSMVGGDVGAGGIADALTMAMGAAVDAYHSGTAFALGQGNTDPLPRIRVYKPLKDALVGTGGSVPIEWYTKWIRADGTRYSPHFSDTFVKPFNQALGHPNEVRYFVKMRPAAGGNFLAADVGTGGDNLTTFAEGSSVAPLGITPFADSATLGTPVKATWRLGGVVDGDYVLRIEAYLEGAAGGVASGNWAYQVIPVKVKQ